MAFNALSREHFSTGLLKFPDGVRSHNEAVVSARNAYSLSARFRADETTGPP
jgi:hypothetical protein